jgi:hypothetical protein
MLSALGLGLAILVFGLSGASKNLPLALLLGLGFLGLGGFIASLQLRSARRRLDVFSEGLRYTDGDKTTEVGWHQVRSVRYRTVRVAGAMGLGAIREKAIEYTLITDRGEMLLEASLSAFDHLGVLLSENIPGLPRA